MSKTSRNDPLKGLVVWLSHHRVGLAASRLSIGEHGSIVTLEHMLDQTVSCFTIYVGLFWRLGEDGVICKTFDVIGLIGFGEVDLVIVGIDLDDGFAVFSFLVRVEGSDADDDFDALTHKED